MPKKHDGLECYKYLLRNAEEILVKTSSFNFIDLLDDPSQKKYYLQLNSFPNNERIKSAKKEIRKKLKPYNLRIDELFYIELALFSMGKHYAIDIWDEAGISLTKKDFSKEITDVIKYIRFFEHSISTTKNPKQPSEALGYLMSVKDKLANESQQYKKFYKKICNRKSGQQEQPSEEMINLLFARIFYLLLQKKVQDNTMNGIAADINYLHSFLYSSIKKYANRTIENAYRTHKKQFLKRRYEKRKLLDKDPLFVYF